MVTGGGDVLLGHSGPVYGILFALLASGEEQAVWEKDMRQKS